MKQSTLQTLQALVKKEITQLQEEKRLYNENVKIHYRLAVPATGMGFVNFKLLNGNRNAIRMLNRKITKLSIASKEIKIELAKLNSEKSGKPRISDEIVSSVSGIPVYHSQTKNIKFAVKY
jgi:hypothetical protein